MDFFSFQTGHFFAQNMCKETSENYSSCSIQIPEFVQLESMIEEYDLAPIQFFATALIILIHRWSGQSECHLTKGEKNGLYLSTIGLTDDITFEELIAFVKFTQKASTISSTNLSVQDAEKETVDVYLTNVKSDKQDKDLNFELEYSSDCITLGLSSSVFKNELISRLVRSYKTLVLEIITHGNQNVLYYSIVDQVEQDLVYSKSQGKSLKPIQGNLIDLFRLNVKKTPDAIAVSEEGGSLTYKQLEAQSDQFANNLIRHDKSTEDVIGLYMTRSSLMMISILGILKAGKSYCVFDTTHPISRVNKCISVANVSTIYFDQVAPEGIDSDAELIEASRCLRAEQTMSEPAIDNSHASSSAYVVFTSGTTGTPKGVQVSHSNVLHLVNHMKNAFSIEQNKNWMQWANMSFDASVFEMWGCWSSGGNLKIVPNTVQANDEELLRWMKSECIHMAYLPNFCLATLEKQLIDGLKMDLKFAMVGAEPIRYQLLHSLAQKMPDCLLYNTYGPSEGTVYCTSITIELQPQDIGDYYAPIGKPIENTILTVRNRLGQLQPFGVAGELYISGNGVATGYINNSSQAVNKFIQTESSTHEKLRSYKTGDSVQYLSNGNIRFIKRIDDQVKIRGLRIELNEIEQILLDLGVKQAVVIPIDVNEQIQLVAFITKSPSYMDSYYVEENFMTLMSQKLPHYMLPSSYIFMDRLPTNHNGKVDRRRMEEFFLEKLESNNKISKPLSRHEDFLQKKIAVITNYPSIDMSRSFIGNGGNSIGAVKLISEIKSEYQLNIKLKEVLSPAPLNDILIQLEQTNQDNENIKHSFEW